MTSKLDTSVLTFRGQQCYDKGQGMSSTAMPGIYIVFRKGTHRMLSEQTVSARFIAIDYSVWDGGVVGGIFRTVSGNILIRIDNIFQYNPLATSMIALELIGKLHRYLGMVPAAKCWPVSILLDRLPEYNEQTQIKGFEKLMVSNPIPLEKLPDFRFIG